MIIAIVSKEEKDSKTSVGGKKTDNRVCKKRNVEEMISDVTYTRLPSGRTTVCEMILKNGFAVTGVTSCIDVDNYDQDLAEELSYKDAKNKLYEFAAYDVATELFVDKNKKIIKTVKSAAKKCVEESQKKELIFQIACFVNNYVDKYMNALMGRTSNYLTETMKELLHSTESELSRNILKFFSWFINTGCVITEENYTNFCHTLTQDEDSLLNDVHTFMVNYLDVEDSKKKDLNTLFLNAHEFVVKDKINIFDELWKCEFKSSVPE